MVILKEYLLATEWSQPEVKLLVPIYLCVDVIWGWVDNSTNYQIMQVRLSMRVHFWALQWCSGSYTHIGVKSRIKFSTFKHNILYIPCMIVLYKVQSALDEHLNFFCELKAGSFRMLLKRYWYRKRGRLCLGLSLNSSNDVCMSFKP